MTTREQIITAAKLADSGFGNGEDADGTMSDSIVGLDAVARFYAIAFESGRDEMRQQVTVLRDGLNDAVAALEHRWEVIANRAAPIMESVIDAAHTKGIKALTATKPKEFT